MIVDSLFASFTRGRWRGIVSGAVVRGALLALATAVATPAVAQTATSNIRGYVRGPGGAAVEGAQLSARNVDNNITRNTLSNAAGFYYMGGLRPGRYEVSMRRVGLAPQVRTVQLPIGQTVDLNLLAGESVVQLAAVEVRSENGSGTARTSEIGTNISREQIENLPSVERNFLDIARLAPGITARRVDDGDKVIAAGGQPAEAVNIFVDGASYKNDVLRGGVVGQDASKGNPFPQGAVQEFRVITQNYKAEYQKASSAIITATTRTGTNRFEADVFSQGIAKAYVARDAITADRNGPRPNYSRLQAGGNVGGPIIPDRLFYFGTYELNFRDSPEYVRFGDTTVANAAPAALRNDLATRLGEFTSTFRQHLGFGKLTYARSDRSTFDLSTTVRRERDFRNFGGPTSFEAAENVRIGVYNGVGTWRYAGQRWLNEAQVSFQNFVWSPEPKEEQTIGREYDRILRIGGRDTRQTFTQNRLALRNDVTRAGVQAFGDHVFKLGGGVDFLTYDAEKFFNGNPVYVYRAETNYSRPSEARFGFGDPRISSDNQQVGFYLQDDWTVTPQLVLNLGIRWDVETNMINNDYVTPRAMADSLRQLYASNQNAFNVGQPTDTNPNGQCCVIRQVRPIDQLGGLENFLTTGRSDRAVYKKAFQPRVGLSYDLFGTGRTVLFGGLGIYYDRNYWNTLLDERFRRQYSVLTARFNDTGPTAQCPQCVRYEERFLDPAQLRTIAGPTGNPEVFLVANDLTPPRTTQMSGGIRQALGRYQVTASYNGIRGRNGMNFVRASPWGGPGPNYNTVFATDGRVKTWYDALQVQVERPMRANARWGGQIAYTLGRSEEQGQSTDIFWGFDDRYPTVADRPRLRAPGDQRHGVVANATVRLPYDIRVSGIANLGTGVSVNGTDESTGQGIFRRSFVFTPPSRPFLGVGNAFNNQSLDLRAEKGLVVGGGNRVSVSADLFNALNSRNFGCYDTYVAPVRTGSTPNANFGRPFCAAPGRRLQVGLRYGFTGAPAASSTSGGQ